MEARPAADTADAHGGKAGEDPGAKTDAAVARNPKVGPYDKRPIIAAFGDSLTAGYGADASRSYPSYLQKLVEDAGKNYRVVNEGTSGDTTTDGLERLPGVLATKPKIVVLELGGNDGLRGIRPAIIKSNLDKMITAIQGEGAQVILAGMTMPRNYGPEYVHQFEQVYVQLADEHHLTRIPFLLDGVALNPKLMQQDGIHPTEDGYKIVADTVFRYLKPALTETRK